MGSDGSYKGIGNFTHPPIVPKSENPTRSQPSNDGMSWGPTALCQISKLKQPPEERHRIGVGKHSPTSTTNKPRARGPQLHAFAQRPTNRPGAVPAPLSSNGEQDSMSSLSVSQENPTPLPHSFPFDCWIDKACVAHSRARKVVSACTMDLNLP